jgi:hypothetical protein
MNKRYKGPIRNIEFDEGIGIKADEPDTTPPAAQPPAAPA